MPKLDWTHIAKEAGKILGGMLTGAATGFATSGTWQGAAVGAALFLGGLLLQRPTMAPVDPAIATAVAAMKTKKPEGAP